MTRIAVIGSRGQLGSDFVTVLRSVEGYQVVALTHDDVDVRNSAVVQAVLSVERPTVVVNCAAFIRVDECEDRPDVAFEVNALGALHVARTCREIGARCVYVSTDYVFGGEKTQPYTEEDVTSPVNVYGVSKLAGEQLVKQSLADALIVRVAAMFGTAGASGKGGSFVEAVLRKAKNHELLRVVDDMRISPTYTADAAAVMERLIRDGMTGVVHVTNAGACTWYEFARTTLDLAGVAASLVPITSAEYPTKARRPANSTLTSGRLPAGARVVLRPWDAALRAYLVEKGHAVPAQPGVARQKSP